MSLARQKISCKKHYLGNGEVNAHVDDGESEERHEEDEEEEGLVGQGNVGEVIGDKDVHGVRVNNIALLDDKDRAAIAVEVRVHDVDLNRVHREGRRMELDVAKADDSIKDNNDQTEKKEKKTYTAPSGRTTLKVKSSTTALSKRMAKGTLRM